MPPQKNKNKKRTKQNKTKQKRLLKPLFLKFRFKAGATLVARTLYNIEKLWRRLCTFLQKQNKRTRLQQPFIRHLMYFILHISHTTVIIEHV